MYFKFAHSNNLWNVEELEKKRKPQSLQVYFLVNFGQYNNITRFY